MLDPDTPQCPCTLHASQAYGVALYADAAAAAAAFAGARQRQGTDEAAAVEALQGGAFTQALQV